MLLSEWRKSWLMSRSLLKNVLDELNYSKITNRGQKKGISSFSIDAELLNIFRQYGILPRSSLELCAADENAWMWILRFLDEVSRQKRNIAYMLPQKSESVVQLSFDGMGGEPCYYSVKGTHTLTGLAIRLMREKACDMMVFSPAALDMKLLKLPAEGSANEDAYNIAFGRAVMAISQAAALYGVPVIFLRRMTHRNDSRGLSAVECRLRIRSAAGRNIRILIDKDSAAHKLSYIKPFPHNIDYARQLEMKYMLDI